MKNIAKLFALAVCTGTLALSSCMEEPVPMGSTALEENLISSDKAAEALAFAMPAMLNKLGTYGSSYHYDWGYGSFMHMRDVETADYAVVASSYNWYDSWSTSTYLGPLYVATYLPWAYYYQSILTCNNLIKNLGNKEDLSKAQQGYLGAGYAFRALYYMDAAQWYEFLPNDMFTVNEDGNDITYLTLPIVTEKTTEDDARNNPRATREEMYEFIMNDLNAADSLMSNYKFVRPNKSMPSLACVYGLKARVNLWVENYEEAAKWARAAIDLGQHSPLTKSEWLDTSKGFNDINSKSWMWGSIMGKEDAVVQTGIVNWTSWMSNEAQYGYAAAGPINMIASALYNKIRDTDFRKLSWKAPEDSPLRGQEPLVIADDSNENYQYNDLPDYASFKFRPGQGNFEDYTVGSVGAFPLMRIEEMYLIEAEATAHIDAEQGATLLEQFMVSYRDASYQFPRSADVIEECILQKRIELWGEGLIAFDYKRLNMSVDRTTSNNWDSAENFKTDGRPAWMNLCIPQTEVDNNPALKGKNNPDPSNAYSPVL